MIEAEDHIRAGTIFRGLLIHSLLGQGEMGAAYLASHPVLRTPMVIKIFKGINKKHVFKEAHLAARVRSPFVVEPVDAGLEQGFAFVTQRYVDGIDLDELGECCRHLGWSLPIGLLARMMAEVARGLHAVHQVGVIHRDVKPANLFLRGDGQCCVGDFGVAVDPVRDASSTAATGTPLFMAPEQWRQAAVGRSTDLYALGATAHLLATGAPPFMARGPLSLACAHTEIPYARPPGGSPEAAYFFAVVERALQKDPADRYPSAEAMAAALDTVAERPLAVRPTPEGARFGDLADALEAGDLAQARCDVIVNAANWAMVMRQGVSASLREAAGASVEIEALKSAPVPMGGVIWTSPGALEARWLAHAVSALEGAVCAQRCTLRALLGAEAREARSVAFPALGTGVGQVPMNLAAHLMLEAVRTFAALRPRHVRQIRVVLYDAAALALWREVLEAMA